MRLPTVCCRRDRACITRRRRKRRASPSIGQLHSCILVVFLIFFSLAGQPAVLVRLLHPGGRIHMHHKNRHKYYTDTVLHWPTLNIYIASRHRLSLHRKYIYVLFGLLIYMVANMAHWTFIGQIHRDRLKLHNPFLGRLDAYTSELSMSFRPSLLGLYYNPRCC